MGTEPESQFISYVLRQWLQILNSHMVRKETYNKHWRMGQRSGDETSEAKYHGVLEDIVELEYLGETVKNITLFYCK